MCVFTAVCWPMQAHVEARRRHWDVFLSPLSAVVLLFFTLGFSPNLDRSLAVPAKLAGQ